MVSFFMYRRRDRRIGTFAACAALAFLACAGSQDRDSRKDAVEPEVLHDIERWTTGDDRRLAGGGGRADTALVQSHVAAGSQSKRISKCLAIDDMLPGPPGSGEIYSIIHGRLHVVESGGNGSFALVETRPARVRLSRLLFFEKTLRPTVLYSVVTSPSRGEELWAFTIRGREATGKRARQSSPFLDMHAFFRRFHVPRCRADGTDCLVTTRQGSDTVLDAELSPGAARREVAVEKGRDVRMASWHPDDRESLLLLVACE